MISLKVIVIFSCCSLAYSGCPLGQDVLQKANTLNLRQAERNRELHETYFVAPTDMAPAPQAQLTREQQQAFSQVETLLNIERLIREDNQQWGIPEDNFQEILDSYNQCVPLNSRCAALRLNCSSTSVYRPLGGLCNNLEHPRWGGVGMAYSNLLPQSYNDGISTIRLSSITRQDLLSPRTIGNAINDLNQIRNGNSFGSADNVRTVGDLANVLTLMMGQFIAHDVGSNQPVAVPGNNNNAMRCCSKQYEKALDAEQRNPSCVAVPVPRDDPFHRNTGVGCLNFVRAQCTFANDCSLKPCQKVNQVSSYLDMTPLYSDTIERSTTKLRTFRGGLIKTNALNVLPEEPCANNQVCFYLGDPRLTQTPQLSLCHSLWLRQHNVNAQNLARVNPQWNDEKLYQEARRLNIAFYQRFVYEEFLPAFLGKEFCIQKLLNNHDSSLDYDPKVDGSSTSDFSHAAFRIFHAWLPSVVNLYTPSITPLRSYKLSDTLGNSNILRERGVYDALARGLLIDPIDLTQFGYNDELRNHLFKNSNNTGHDLFVFDMMRHRDTGTASYISYFPICLGVHIESWRDLEPYFDINEFRVLTKSYESPIDVDLFVGMMLEKRSRGDFGPIGACILAEQFYRLRYGDRFFYAHQRNPKPFTPSQLDEIKEYSFAKFICAITSLEDVPRIGSHAYSSTNGLVKCSSLNKFNYDLFRE